MTAQPESTPRWGFSSLGAPEMTLADLADLGSRLGYPFLELRTLNNTIDLPSVLDKEFGSGDGARAVLASRNVEVICLNSSFKLTQSTETDRETLVSFARWADRLGAPFIRVFGGGKWGEQVSGDQYSVARGHVAWWNQAKKENGWKAGIVLETHDAFSGSPQCLELFEKIGQALPVIWDSHHTWKLAGESLRETWERLGRHVRHLHVKDSVSQPSDKHPYSYVHLGEGEFPMRDLMELLREVNYGGVIAVEWEKLWHPYLDPLEEALRRARKNGVVV